MSGAAEYHRDMYDEDSLAARAPSLDPVGSDFSDVLHTRLLDLSERGVATAVAG